MLEEEKRENLEKAKRYELSKQRKVCVKGVRRNVKRSEKPPVVRVEVKREVLSEEQIDIYRYLAMNLDEEGKQQ